MKLIYTGFSILLASLCLSFFAPNAAKAAEQETVELKMENEGFAPKFEYIEGLNLDHTIDYSAAKLTAVHFWATWCAPCIDELPQVSDTQGIFGHEGTFGGSDFKVVAIAIDGRNIAKVQRFFYDYKIKNLTAYVDPTQNTPKLAKLPGLPGTIFVNSKGMIIARANGPLDWQSDRVQKFIKRQIRG